MKRILTIIVILLFFTSCKKFLDMPPKNIKVVYGIADVRGAMSTFLYATTNSSAGATISKPVRFNNEYVQYPFTRAYNVSFDMYSNDLDLTSFINQEVASPNRGGVGFLSQYTENKDWKGYDFSGKLWKEVFISVGYLNSVLRDLKRVPDPNIVDVEQISGEAKVIRSYYLLRLNQLFAPLDNDDMGIPFNLDADIIEPTKRWSQKALYKKLIGDIKEVMAFETPPKPSWNIFYNQRIMHAILAQTYLFKASTIAAEPDDYENAALHAKEARGGNRIENTIEEQQELTTVPFQAVVNKPHKFSLLRFALYASGPNDYSPWGYQNQMMQQSPSAELYNLYDSNDIRRDVYFKTEGSNVFMIKLITNSNHAINDVHSLFRFSDLLLIEAEAKYNIGDKASALLLLNVFKKSKIPGYSGYNGNELLEEIWKERRKEFVLEEEMNWLDMRRINRAVRRQAKDEATNKIETYSLTANDYRYTLPLPIDFELKNNEIPQNPGWK